MNDHKANGQFAPGNRYRFRRIFGGGGIKGNPNGIRGGKRPGAGRPKMAVSYARQLIREAGESWT